MVDLLFGTTEILLHVDLRHELSAVGRGADRGKARFRRERSR
jgi:hypothetical protein